MQTSFDPSLVAELQTHVEALYYKDRFQVFVRLLGPDGIRTYGLYPDTLCWHLTCIERSLKDGYRPESVCFEYKFDVCGWVRFGKEFGPDGEHFFSLCLQNDSCDRLLFTARGNSFTGALRNIGDGVQGQWLWRWHHERDRVCTLLEDMCGVEKGEDND